MNKSEIQPIQELAEKRRNLSRVVEQNETLKANLDAPLGEGGFTIVPPRRLIKREMSFPEVKEVAKYNLRHTPEKIDERKQELRSKIDADSQKRQSELEQIDQRLEELAPVYVAVLNTLTDDITELAELWTQGGLEDEEFALLKEDFDEIASLPDQLPGLKRGIENLKSQTEDPAQERGLGELVKPALRAIGDMIERTATTAAPEPAEYDWDSVPPGLLVDELEYPPFAREHIASRKKGADPEPAAPNTSHWLDNVRTDPDDNSYAPIETQETQAEKEKTKVKIHLLADDKLKIGERVINLSGKHSALQKDYSEERIQVLKVLVANQGKLFDSRELWNEAFPNEQFNQRALAQIKVWLDKFITHRSAPIIYHNGKRGLASRYGITRFDVELIEPGKKADKKPLSADKEHIVKKPRAQSEDVLNLPDNTVVRGKKATLLKHAELITEDPANSITIAELAIALFGSSDIGHKRQVSGLVSAINAELAEKLGFRIASTFGLENFRGQEVRYYRKIITTTEVAQSIEPTATKTATESTPTEPQTPKETTEEKVTRLTPTPEEATLLAGYLELRKDILIMLGIDPLDPDIYKALETDSGEENHRKVDDIQRLRRSALRKSIELIENRLLDAAIDKLDPQDPRSSLLIYLLSIQNEAVVLEAQALPEGELMSAFDFLKLLVESNASLTGQIDAKTYRIGDATNIVLTSPHGHSVSINLNRAPEKTESQPNTNVNVKDTLDSATPQVEAVLFEQAWLSGTGPEADDPTERETDDETIEQQPDVPEKQPTPEELANAFLAGEAARRKENPRDQAVIDDFAEDIRTFYEQLGGLNPEGVNISTFLGRFPYVQMSDIKNAFENNVISESTKGGAGGTLLTHESMVRLLFHKHSRGMLSAKPDKRAFERALKKVKKEREQNTTKRPEGVDEDGFIEG